MGFSQGGCIALLTALDETIPVGFAISISGWMPLLEPPVDSWNKKVPMWLAHGTVDSVVPFSWGLDLQSELQRAGVSKLHFEAVEGSDHARGEMPILRNKHMWSALKQWLEGQLTV